jgi:DUF438 domain-containing protein
MAKTQSQNKVHSLAELLQRIDEGNDLRDLCHEAGQLADKINPQDMAIAEQSLVESGYAQEVAHQLTTLFVFMGMYDQSTAHSQQTLPHNHMARRMAVEHDFFRCFGDELKELTDTILAEDALTDVSVEFRSLMRTARNLYRMREHMECEEDLIFPYLRKRGYGSLCRAAEREHSHLREQIDNLMALVLSFNGIPFGEFQIRLTAVTQQLVPDLRDHLSLEDKLLYPMALVVIDDPRTWHVIKALYDQMGYGDHAA